MVKIVVFALLMWAFACMYGMFVAGGLKDAKSFALMISFLLGSMVCFVALLMSASSL